MMWVTRTLLLWLQQPNSLSIAALKHFNLQHIVVCMLKCLKWTCMQIYPSDASHRVLVTVSAPASTAASLVWTTVYRNTWLSPTHRGLEGVYVIEPQRGKKKKRRRGHPRQILWYLSINYPSLFFLLLFNSHPFVVSHGPSLSFAPLCFSKLLLFHCLVCMCWIIKTPQRSGAHLTNS